MSKSLEGSWSGPPRRRGAFDATTLETTDVAIIGGGIMGSAVALRLAQRGSP